MCRHSIHCLALKSPKLRSFQTQQICLKTDIMIIRENASEQIRLEPNIACPQPQLNFDSCVGDKAVIKSLWATPVSQVWSPCSRCTPRCIQNISTQLMFEAKTIEQAKSMQKSSVTPQQIAKKSVVNPEWIEWLFGYPIDFTGVFE